MRNGRFFRLALGTLVVLVSSLSAVEARSGSAHPVTPDPNGHGFASVYGSVPASQAESLSTPDQMKSAAASGAPTLVWEVLEHGERVECLDCIPGVARLLYDRNAKTREIAAWWLRRRIFGVFGPGEVYEQTIQTLASDADADHRAYAAYALGEFFATPGIAACAQAIGTDAEPRVRAAAASALGRLNDDGAGALTMALGDSDPTVKLAALSSAARVNTFSGLSAVAAIAMDADARVRRRAVEVLDALHAKDTVVAVAAVAQSDADAGVRAAAAHALGTFRDSSARAVLEALATTDPDTFVRDQAQIAIRRL
ncbi:MAG: HEAT repeat domain-containing protein [Myxococcales bacterium]|nr:HEAT repeat domain-containing protein [Myxococcales bacterium]